MPCIFMLVVYINGQDKSQPSIVGLCEVNGNYRKAYHVSD
jgi:hypothetical protein